MFHGKNRQAILQKELAAAAPVGGRRRADRLFHPRLRERKAEGREAYIRSLGWEIDPASETHKSVRIPDPLTEVLEHYNEIQQKQGLDLTGHLGESCEQYCYTVTNYPDEEETVQISLYTQGRELIAGDVHSTALRGFMQGLQKEP